MQIPAGGKRLPVQDPLAPHGAFRQQQSTTHLLLSTWDPGSLHLVAKPQPHPSRSSRPLLKGASGRQPDSAASLSFSSLLSSVENKQALQVLEEQAKHSCWSSQEGSKPQGLQQLSGQPQLEGQVESTRRPGRRLRGLEHRPSRELLLGPALLCGMSWAADPFGRRGQFQ